MGRLEHSVRMANFEVSLGNRQLADSTEFEPAARAGADWMAADQDCAMDSGGWNVNVSCASVVVIGDATGLAGEPNSRLPMTAEGLDGRRRFNDLPLLFSV